MYRNTHQRSGAQSWALECPNVQKLKRGGFWDQYGPEYFEV